jgi:hypothetical protein
MIDAIDLQRRFPSAYWAGVKACLRNKGVDDNPHPRSPAIRTEWRAWDGGYTSTLNVICLEEV